MDRSVLIVGNGLGMALDPEYYNLTNAIRDVWNTLSDRQKQLILCCLSRHRRQVPPQGEQELDHLHMVVVACDFLRASNKKTLTP